MSINLRQAAEQAITAILACIDYIPDNTSQGDKDATAAEEAVKALRAALSQQPAAPNIDVRTILLAIVPGDGNGEEVYAESVDDVVAKMTELSEREESLRTQVDLLTAAVEARGREIAKLKATGEPVRADSSEHLRVIASLGDALRRLSFAAQTTGGTAGPDAELQSAIGQAEQALSLGGIWQAMSATGEPVEDGIRNAEDELNCAEELLDAITCEFSNGEFPVTDFNCSGDYITAVVDVFKERLAAQQPATGEPSKDEVKRLIDTLRTDASGGRAATVHELDAAADLIEASLSATGEPVVPDGVWEALQRLIENGFQLGPASADDSLLVARYRKSLLNTHPAPSGHADVVLTIHELREIQRAVDDFSDCGETDVPDRILMRGVMAGYLECTNYMVVDRDGLRDAAK